MISLSDLVKESLRVGVWAWVLWTASEANPDRRGSACYGCSGISSGDFVSARPAVWCPSTRTDLSAYPDLAVSAGSRHGAYPALRYRFADRSADWSATVRPRCSPTPSPRVLLGESPLTAPPRLHGSALPGVTSRPAEPGGCHRRRPGPAVKDHCELRSVRPRDLQRLDG